MLRKLHEHFTGEASDICISNPVRASQVLRKNLVVTCTAYCLLFPPDKQARPARKNLNVWLLEDVSYYYKVGFGAWWHCSIYRPDSSGPSLDRSLCTMILTSRRGILLKGEVVLMPVGVLVVLVRSAISHRRLILLDVNTELQLIGASALFKLSTWLPLHPARRTGGSSVRALMIWRTCHFLSGLTVGLFLDKLDPLAAQDEAAPHRSSLLKTFTNDGCFVGVLNWRCERSELMPSAVAGRCSFKLLCDLLRSRSTSRSSGVRGVLREAPGFPRSRREGDRRKDSTLFSFEQRTMFWRLRMCVSFSLAI